MAKKLKINPIKQMSGWGRKKKAEMSFSLDRKLLYKNLESLIPNDPLLDRERRKKIVWAHLVAYCLQEEGYPLSPRKLDKEYLFATVGTGFYWNLYHRAIAQENIKDEPLSPKIERLYDEYVEWRKKCSISGGRPQLQPSLVPKGFAYLVARNNSESVIKWLDNYRQEN